VISVSGLQFLKSFNINKINGTITAPKTADPPFTFYFGVLTDPNDNLNAENCAYLCTLQPLCQYFTYFFALYDDVEWRQQCYGRSFNITTEDTPELEAVSGARAGFTIESGINRIQLSTPRTQTLPNSFFFGEFTNTDAINIQHCIVACSVEPLCLAYTYFGIGYATATYRGQCYGRSNVVLTKSTGVVNITSGVRLFDRNYDRITGLVPTPMTQSPPSTFYFGLFTNFDEDVNIQNCWNACATSTGNCQFFTFYNNTFSQPAWRGQCYGQNGATTYVYNVGATSGARIRF